MGDLKFKKISFKKDGKLISEITFDEFGSLQIGFAKTIEAQLKAVRTDNYYVIPILNAERILTDMLRVPDVLEAKRAGNVMTVTTKNGIYQSIIE